MVFVPDALPILSAGKHRSPRTGGCFMEVASFLAGERWSDHPKCADPALAELARCVNDVMPDSARSTLTPMIPSVIGTGGRRPAERVQLAAAVVRAAALPALPLVKGKARPLACALLVAEQVLGESTREAMVALTTQPQAHAFALTFLADNPYGWTHTRTYLARAVPQALRCAVRAVDEDLGPAAPPVLTTMLAGAITSTRQRCGLTDLGVDADARDWQAACDLVGRRR